MKGIVFTSFNDMVEEHFGLETWETLVKKANLQSKGIYTAGATYPNAELITLVKELSSITKTDPSTLVENFGLYLFPILAKKYPAFLPEGISFKDFMKSIDHVIHVEVKKLYPEASLPSISYEDVSPNQFTLLYRSPRKFCALAVGLTKGAAAHFNVPIHIQHPVCMHQGADHCRLEINCGQ